MSYTDRHIVEAYSELFAGLSADAKIDLIESLSKSLKKENKNKERNFFKSFGAFGSSKPAEEIVAEIKASRKFRKKDVTF
jgi:hypothetical protein